MKLKQLFLNLFVMSVLFVSCTKEDVYDPIKTSETVITESSTIKTMQTTTVSSTVNKAYIFVEPFTKFQTVKTYLLSLPRTPLYSFNFSGFFGVNGDSWKYTYQNYVDMPYWNNGTLPSIIESNIPQTSGGVDSYGNPKLAYCFETVKIPKNTTVGMAWITILVPVSAMDNDIKKLKTVYSYQKNGTTGALITNGSITGWSYIVSNGLSNYIINYQGNRLPKGLYRIYSTYPDTSLRPNLNATNDYYLRGSGAL